MTIIGMPFTSNIAYGFIGGFITWFVTKFFTYQVSFTTHRAWVSAGTSRMLSGNTDGSA